MTMGNQGQSDYGGHGPDSGRTESASTGLPEGAATPTSPLPGYNYPTSGAPPPPGTQQGWTPGYAPPGAPQGWTPGYAPPGWQGGGPFQASAQDHEQLRALSIVYYIFAGLHAAGLVCVVAWLFLGTAILGSISADTRNAVPAAFTAALAAVMILALVLGGAYCYLYYLVGRSLAEHNRYTLILVMAGLTCLSFPLGTALGVCTFVVLMRPSVKPLFGQT